jgi:hypothetical protein
MTEETRKSSLPASLLWVNHNAQNMQSQPHRQKVFSHIQQHYRPWLKRDSALKLRKSAKVPVPGDRRTSLESEDHSSDYSVRTIFLMMLQR